MTEICTPKLYEKIQTYTLTFHFFLITETFQYENVQNVFSVHGDIVKSNLKKRS